MPLLEGLKRRKEKKQEEGQKKEEELNQQAIIDYEVQLINVNSKMRKNLFYFLTKKGRTFPLVKISFFERY